MKFSKFSIFTESSFSGRQKLSNFFKANVQFFLTLAGVVAGISIGFGLRPLNLGRRGIDLIGFPGEIFMNMLKMMILPLISASLVSGLSQIDAKQSGRIGAVSMCYYTLTLFLSVVTGMVVVLAIHPGHSRGKLMDGGVGMSLQQSLDISPLDKVLDLIRNMFPENIVRATFQTVQSEYSTTAKLSLTYSNGINVLGIIVFSMVLGIVSSHVGKAAQPLSSLFVALDAVITRIVVLIMFYAPLGIASLIASKILDLDDIQNTARMLGMYIFTVAVGLSLHLFVVLPLVYLAATRKNPFPFLRGMGPTIVTALATSSSAASLPVTFRCVEDNNHVKAVYTKFVLPIGAMINMDGTALYEAVASIFIAQLNGFELNAGHLIIICVTSVLAAVGAASIPSAGLVTLLMVLEAVGLPTDDISLIIAVDWILGRLRTVVNVCGDGFGCGVVEAICDNWNNVQDEKNHVSGDSNV